MIDPVRVRYAPSPTGNPHVGNIRTAIFNWLFAKHFGGVFVLRIEDTDQNRKVDGALENILESLRWLELDWDEGPEVGGSYGSYFQSERLEIYKEYSEQLLSSGQAYKCYCSPDRLKEMRDKQQHLKQSIGYDGLCRTEKGRDQAMKLFSSRPVLRFKTPSVGQSTFIDSIRGQVYFENSLMDDFVILKSDGYPTYHMANVIDDHLMGITHVLRADEWLSSGSKHLMLYKAFSWPPPIFAHLPIILGNDRSKLSKRHGAVSILEYRNQGFLPDVMLNFLALLGWSIDDKTEIISRDDLIRQFSIERIGKSGAIFDQEKLEWMNGFYIRTLSTNKLTEIVASFIEKATPIDLRLPVDRKYLQKITPLIQERLKTLSEAPDITEFFFKEELIYDVKELVKVGLNSKEIQSTLPEILRDLQVLDRFEPQSVENLLRSCAEKFNLKPGLLFRCLRLICTGRQVSPPLFETMSVIGRRRCVNRMSAVIKLLSEIDSGR